MACISRNAKTIRSCDFTTDCPLRRKGKACKYCYVESARDINYNAKNIVDFMGYDGAVKKYTRQTIEKLNGAGGIRLFSFGDYMPDHRNDCQRFLDDCHAKGLQVKAITKQTLFIDTFGSHPAIRRIHISIDNTNDSPVAWETAKEYRDSNNKVKIRCAIMKDEDIKAMEFVDVFTFNHARGLKKHGFKMYSKKKVAEMAKIYPGKVCCQTGNCATCPIKCIQ